MRFEIYTDYAIRALRLLHVNNGKVMTIMEIALAIDTTSPIFGKIAGKLRRAGMLKTIKGQKGGFVLGRPANEISIYDVYICMEGELRLNKCLETGELCEHGKRVDCKVHGMVYGLQEEMIEKMSSVSIADIV